MDATTARDEQWRRIAFLTVTGTFAFGILYAFREVLAPFAVALVVAYVFAPIVDWLESRRVAGRLMPRWLAVLLIYLSLLGTLAASIALGAPLLAQELARLGRETPRMIATVRDEWLPVLDDAVRRYGAHLSAAATTPDQPPTTGPIAGPTTGASTGLEADGTSVEPTEASQSARSGLLEVRPRADGSYEVSLPSEGIVILPIEEGGYVVRARAPVRTDPTDVSVQITEALRRQFQESEQTAGEALRTAQSLVAAVVNGIFKFFIMLMISAYILITKDGILGFFRTLVSPHRRQDFDLLLHRMDKGLAGVVRGQLLICLVNGVLSGVGFYVAELNYWPVLTLLATVLSIIPIFGAILSSIPAVLIALQQSFGTALFTLAWIIGIHQVEANLLNPKIMGDAAKVHPVLVVFSLIAGEHFFGILGALLAVPVLSIAQTLFLHFREAALGVPVSTGVSSPGLAPREPRSDSFEPGRSSR